MDIFGIVEMQKKLDKAILDKHGLLEADTLKNRILALIVELGELANETRCFKYWSLKAPSEKSVILEEYVDGIHFIVSIGNTIGYEFKEDAFDATTSQDDPTTGFIKVFERITNLSKDMHETNFESLWNEYINLGKLFGFTKDDVMGAYEEKNRINHERQASNY